MTIYEFIPCLAELDISEINLDNYTEYEDAMLDIKDLIYEKEKEIRVAALENWRKNIIDKFLNTILVEKCKEGFNLVFIKEIQECELRGDIFYIPVVGVKANVNAAYPTVTEYTTFKIYLERYEEPKYLLKLSDTSLIENYKNIYRFIVNSLRGV